MRQRFYAWLVKDIMPDERSIAAYDFLGEFQAFMIRTYGVRSFGEYAD